MNPTNTKSISLKLSPRQESLYRNLKMFGDSVACFYYDALLILDFEGYQAKTNLIYHLAREIDGGIRDALCYVEKNEGSDENKITHLESILLSLGIEAKNELAKKWYEVASNFHKYAHRDGKRRKIRDFQKLRKNWEEFEDILILLAGGNLNLKRQIDRIIKYEKPSKDLLKTINKAILDQNLSDYFYMNLSSPDWFSHLEQSGNFEVKNMPSPVKNGDNINDIIWMPLFYLNRIASSQEIDQTLQTKIIQIVVRINEKEKKKNEIYNHRNWYYLIRILSKLSVEVIPDQLLETLSIWNVKSKNSSVIDLIVAELIPSLLVNEDKAKIVLKKVLSFYELKKENSYYGNSTEYLVVGTSYRLNKVLSDSRILKILSDRINVESLIVDLETVIKWKFFGYDAVFDYKSKNYKGEAAEVYFGLLKNLIDFKIGENDSEWLLFCLERCLQSEEYRIQNFSSYIAQKNFEINRPMVLTVIGAIDFQKGASCNKDLYRLFELHSVQFNEEEINLISNKLALIKESERDLYVKLDWLSSLLKIDRFKDQYESLTKGLDNYTTPNLYSKRRATITSGSRPPMSKEALLAMSDSEIMNKVLSFQPDFMDSSKGSIDGFATLLSECFREYPERFVKEIDQYITLPFDYIYKIIYLLADVDLKEIHDWNTIFRFFLKYITQDAFSIENSSLNLSPSITKEFIAGNIGYLIKKVVKHSQLKLDEEILRELEIELLKYIKKEENVDFGSDPLMFSLNSNNCKIMQSYYRFYDIFGDDSSWKEEVIAQTEAWLRNGYKEIYLLLGENFSVFYKRNKAWVTAKMAEIEKEENELFEGFLYCLLAYHDPGGYDLFYPLLKREVERAESFSQSGDNMLIYHLNAYFLWGDDCISEETSLVKRLIDKNKVEAIKDFIIKLSNQTGYWEGLDKKGQEELRIRIYELWKYVLSKTKNSDISESLFYLTMYIDELDETAVSLLENTLPNIKDDGFYYTFFEEFERLKETGDVRKTALQFGQFFFLIISNLDSIHYSNDDCVKFVTYLYAQNDEEIKVVANKIANLFGENGIYDFKDLYFENNGLN